MNFLKRAIVEQPVISLSVLFGTLGPLMVLISSPDSSRHIKPFLEPPFVTLPEKRS
ncbi:hypothetical protein CAOG_08058 [Capsaspora owczarzaki ATCC 30864]|uniref:Uncharacterized protein n=1 Tax=Capsaspora owczarzaki (strain ATCC 30864) TaxID=595528 RepID=A0A0D2X5L1_CAPO3|nr:hypothetical protein CAOG_08058 [Capsaspora owczarzaki ATCC 30864]KJE97999.1 hypothetical protein CAOG_008058 [Capsaspora owczarzaki ATCC 30864]|eukprot:XP_004342659.1 hypothetical protein CAOG_08058 [Capsaspora owczarzaki ATCC 30864]